MTGAEVVAVFPDRIRIAVDDISKLTEPRSALDKGTGQPVEVGSYLRVFDHNECAIIAIIESFSIELKPTRPKPDGSDRDKVYMIDAVPLGLLRPDGTFERGGGKIAIPPKHAEVAAKDYIQRIYDGIEPKKRFHFAQLAQDSAVEVPVDGNRFFNKHIAIVGSTGAGKSHAVARIVQSATQIRDDSGTGYHLNNSHVVIFDIHAEYRNAFPTANHISVESLVLPYWLLNSEELQDMFIESSEEQSYNQIAILKKRVTENRKAHFDGPSERRDRLHYDSPVFFDLNEVVNAIRAKNEERLPGTGSSGKQGPLFGKLENFITRLENRVNDARLDFLLGSKTRDVTLEDTLRQFTGYKKDNESNVTVIDLSGVPFEVLSICVALISRLLFEYAYYFKRRSQTGTNDAPLLVVFEEVHKYAPRNDAARYNSSRTAIERIIKEGRKYGVTAAIVSQRPAEVSETIFSQCSNFIAMRLTNPEDQGYVRRLLPDVLGPLTATLPSLSAGEALLIGDAVVMPSVVKLHAPDPAPESSDINYLEVWRRQWENVAFDTLIGGWRA
jgi:DNA helicase HerA-like ATPase